MSKLKIRQIGQYVTELELNGQPVDLKYLKEINIHMSATELTTLTLTYDVHETEIAVDAPVIKEMKGTRRL